MESKARIITTARGMDGGFTVTLALDGATRAELEKLQDIDLTAILKEYVDKRGNAANAYFHTLVRKISRHKDIKRSETYVKNDLIGQAAFYEYIDGQPATITTNLEPEKMMEQEILHTKLVRVDYDAETDTVIYKYLVCRPTHTYNRREFSHLIELTVQQAKSLDIETLPPDEILKLEEAWEQEQLRREKARERAKSQKKANSA